MDEAKELMGALSQMMQSANSVEVVHKIVVAYDNFASKAMQVLLNRASLPLNASPDEIAKMAWKIADAMMRERAERGLGRMPTAPPEEIV